MATPFISICPHCQTKLKLKNPDLIGKKAKCPACQENFRVVKSAEAVEKPKAKSGSKPKAAAKPKSKPKPSSDDELDPWMSEDLGDFESQDDDWPPKAPKTGGAAPPAVTGVRKKKKPSADGGKKKRKKSSGGGMPAAWIGWVVGGGIAGLLGAALWGAVAFFTLNESAIIAWGVGGFVGFGVRVGSREEDAGVGPGAVAVGIAIASIILGKFLAVHFLVTSLESTPEDTAHEETVEWIISDYADEISYEWEDEGREIDWPDWESLPEDASIREEYPEDLWAAAEEEWNSLSDEEKAEEILAWETGDFEPAFGILDLVFFFLATVTAFKVGSGLDFGDD